MYSELSAEQTRQLVDTTQAFEVYRETEAALGGRFAGSMSWKSRGKKRYLYRIIKGSESSLGSESAETQKAYDAFRKGKAEAVKRYKSLQDRLDEMAPVNRAMRLGRVPLTSARLLRLLDAEKVLGNDIIVVGTNALYAYEAAASVQFEGGMLATTDVDLLLDSRRKLGLASDKLSRKGLLGLLARADRTFKPMRGRRYRSANAKGFMVDLIAPQGRNPLTKSGRLYLGSAVDDLEAAEIEGLIWLLNVPKFEAVAIGEDGHPVRIVCPDPRAFAAHKLWLARRQDRDPQKKGRDRQQAGELIDLISERLINYPLDGHELSALPSQLLDALLEFTSTDEVRHKNED